MSEIKTKPFKTVLNYVFKGAQEKITESGLETTAFILSKYHILEKKNGYYYLDPLYKAYYAKYSTDFSTSGFENFIKKNQNTNDSYLYNQAPDILYFLISSLKDKKEYIRNPFEVFCYDLLLHIFKNTTIALTPKSKDSGIDIIGQVFLDKYHNVLPPITLCCQCKLYNLACAVNVSQLRDFIGATASMDCQRIFITTGYFSPECISLAKERNIKLIDGIDLCILLKDADFNLYKTYSVTPDKINEVLLKSKEDVCF